MNKPMAQTHVMDGNPMSLGAGPSPLAPSCLKKIVTVANPQGLHLRPATTFAKLARQFASAVTVRRDDRIVNGKSQVELILLAAEPGAQLELEVLGPDADAALPVLAEVLERSDWDESDE